MGRGREMLRPSRDGGFRDRILLSRAHLNVGYLLAAPSLGSPDATTRATILTVPIELITVWGAVVTFMSGTSGLWAWWTGADVTSCLEDGFIAGFICGLPITVCAAIAVIVWG